MAQMAFGRDGKFSWDSVGFLLCLFSIANSAHAELGIPAVSTEPWSVRGAATTFDGEIVNAWDLDLTLSERLHDDASDGYLDDFSFFTAALIGSGIDSPTKLAQLRQEFDQWCSEQAGLLESVFDPREKARLLLHALHETWCTGQYFAACARVDQTLTDGHFNCVTATILYHVACDRVGLPSQIIAVPGHVFTRILLDTPLDVQTTASSWLDPEATHPAVPDGTERPLSEVQLVGKLFYNLGVAKLAQQRFDEAAGLFRTALTWDPQDQAAGQNLLAALNNGALALANQRQYQRALEMLEQGLHYDPEFAPLLANYRHVAGKWFSDLVSRGRRAKAGRVLDSVISLDVVENQRWIAEKRRDLFRQESIVSSFAADADQDTNWYEDLTTSSP